MPLSGEKVKGKVVIMADEIDSGPTKRSETKDFHGHSLELRLVSATAGDPENGYKGLVGPAAYLEPYSPPGSPADNAGETTYAVTFSVDGSHGIPGAVIVNNHHQAQVYLKSITVDSFPGKGRIFFDCNSWVHGAGKYTSDRMFFANDPYLPRKTPEPLQAYRREELRKLRGDDVNREMGEWDRVYNYALYDDLGKPDAGNALARPVLGGSAALPYPRRGKAGRRPTNSDPSIESQASLLNSDNYVPHDERVWHKKGTDFLGFAIKSVATDLLPMLHIALGLSNDEFGSFEEIFGLYATTGTNYGAEVSRQ